MKPSDELLNLVRAISKKTGRFPPEGYEQNLALCEAFASEHSDVIEDAIKRRKAARQEAAEAAAVQIEYEQLKEVQRVEHHDTFVLLVFEDCTISDHGQTLTLFEGTDEAGAKRIVSLAKKKGWKTIRFDGDEAFVKAGMRQAIEAGLTLKPSDLHQQAIIEELRKDPAIAYLLAMQEVQQPFAVSPVPVSVSQLEPKDITEDLNAKIRSMPTPAPTWPTVPSLAEITKRLQERKNKPAPEEGTTGDRAYTPKRTFP